MSSAGDRQRSSRESRAPDPDPASSQLSEDVKIETSGVGTSASVGHTPPVDHQSGAVHMKLTPRCVKKEEMLELNVCNSGNDLNNIPEVSSIKEEETDDKDYLYCEVCKSFFFKKCDVHGPALFVPDTPVPMGVPDRARQTLPPGLEIRKSGIPDAGLGVFNKGETVPVGAHFGPYQGELVDREEAMNSGYSWVISRSGQREEYIDAKREMYANWMRYVNCAHNDGEQNLMAFQYQGGILYRCCRPINPGQELLVWYEANYAKDLGTTFDYLWNKKCSTNGAASNLQAAYKRVREENLRLKAKVDSLQERVAALEADKVFLQNSLSAALAKKVTGLDEEASEEERKTIVMRTKKKVAKKRERSSSSSSVSSSSSSSSSSLQKKKYKKGKGKEKRKKYRAGEKRQKRVLLPEHALDRYQRVLKAVASGLTKTEAYAKVGVDRKTVADSACIAELAECDEDAYNRLRASFKRGDKMSDFVARCKELCSEEPLKTEIIKKKEAGSLLDIFERKQNKT
ncbi:PR domain zinc finger protein 15 isoform X2 [Pangasianodon hypophthalmus]|uniref:PR domain zinc finger protein 15 isoform X2 n=1 Tax=Pangasianodon hypophthalmus TaxID=310915 RepID=UPI002308345B|nr:PR domain zinc finger protein 15 isoform X2 [Pangasianodon hypophthalmus]